MNKVQVNKEHYQFKNYLNKKRWMSIWYQLNEVLSLEPESILEIGQGAGLFKIIMNHFDMEIKTVDIDPELNPDIVGSINNLPIATSSYDCVCAFQVLEHLPYKQALEAFKEMINVSKKYVVISLPDAKVMWTYSIYVPKIGQKTILLPRPKIQKTTHNFDGEHYWEINKKGYSLNLICKNFLKIGKISLVKNFRIAENPYHRFFLFAKNY